MEEFMLNGWEAGGGSLKVLKQTDWLRSNNGGLCVSR